MSAYVTVWADGFARWHAETADSPRALTRCIEAIATELHERAPRGTMYSDILEYVNLNIVSGTPSAPGLIHMIECDLT